MYSDEIKQLLEKKGIKIGDQIKIKKNKESYQGSLMPKTRSGKSDSIVIKLENGYNLGIKLNDSSELIKVGESEVKNKEKGLDLEFNKDKPKVALIAIGGTISSKVDYKTGGVRALKDPKELLEDIPELADIVNLEVKSPFTKMSEDMNSKDWKKLAEVVSKELNNDKEGVIISQGTDTLHYTSSALSFMLEGLNNPVVVTGAQRSSDRASSDAAMNLICSAKVAASKIPVVGTCLHATTNDNFCYLIKGTKSRKMHSSRRDAFRPINDLPIAKVFPEKGIEKIDKSSFWTEQESDSNKKDKIKVKNSFEDKTALIKIQPGSDPKILDYYLEEGYKGFVIEGTGLGHVPTNAEKSWTEKIKNLIEKEIPVVVTSQTIYGRIHKNVYSNLRELFKKSGAISGKDMTSETAYVKLSWLLAQERDFETIKEKMEENLTGEITEKNLEKQFLF